MLRRTLPVPRRRKRGRPRRHDRIGRWCGQRSTPRSNEQGRFDPGGRAQRLVGVRRGHPKRAALPRCRTRPVRANTCGPKLAAQRDPHGALRGASRYSAGYRRRRDKTAVPLSVPRYTAKHINAPRRVLDDRPQSPLCRPAPVAARFGTDTHAPAAQRIGDFAAFHGTGRGFVKPCRVVIPLAASGATRPTIGAWSGWAVRGVFLLYTHRYTVNSLLWRHSHSVAVLTPSGDCRWRAVPAPTRRSVIWDHRVGFFDVDTECLVFVGELL